VNDTLASGLEELHDFVDRGRFLPGEAVAAHLDQLPALAAGLGHQSRWSSKAAFDEARSIAAWTRSAGQAWRSAREQGLHARLVRALSGVVLLHEERKAAAGLLAPLDTLLEVRRVLREDEALRGWVRRRFTRVFADDAQDSDPLEIEILRSLGGEHLVVSGDPLSAAGRAPRGDRSLFLRLTDEARRDDPRSVLVLGSSLRAGPAVSQFLARAFSDLDHGCDETTMEQGALGASSLVGLPVEVDTGGRRGLAGAEARAIAAFVEQVEGGDLRIWDRIEGRQRPGRLSDVLILARTTARLEPVRLALRARNLELMAGEGPEGPRGQTIVEARGIEAPVVVLVGLADAEPIHPQAIRLWEEGGVAIQLHPRCRPPRWETLVSTETERLRAERRRLLWVACTRARDHLVIPTTPAPPAGCLLEDLLPHLPGDSQATKLPRRRSPRLP
jgi:ATP-dependent exoDNAse (exonuclease V) beta subunit